MSLAQRVRDIRYSKGWGPDELANRAEISRTALYQIESGKTGLPRAGTLRRIAVALEVPMEDLLGHEDDGDRHASADSRADRSPRRSRGLHDWVPSEGGPLSMPPGRQVPGARRRRVDDLRFRDRIVRPGKTNGHESIYVREGELMSKLHDLLHSPIGDGVARIRRGAARTAAAVPFFGLIANSAHGRVLSGRFPQDR